jgi:hypothetical protein
LIAERFDRAALQREEMLAALPGLLTLARQVIASFEAGDPEIDGLKSLLDECVVSAHRLALRERIEALEGSEGECE